MAQSVSCSSIDYAHLGVGNDPQTEQRTHWHQCRLAGRVRPGRRCTLDSKTKWPWALHPCLHVFGHVLSGQRRRQRLEPLGHVRAAAAHYHSVDVRRGKVEACTVQRGKATQMMSVKLTQLLPASPPPPPPPPLTRGKGAKHLHPRFGPDGLHHLFDAVDGCLARRGLGGGGRQEATELDDLCTDGRCIM